MISCPQSSANQLTLVNFTSNAENMVRELIMGEIMRWRILYYCPASTCDRAFAAPKQLDEHREACHSGSFTSSNGDAMETAQKPQPLEALHSLSMQRLYASWI